MLLVLLVCSVIYAPFRLLAGSFNVTTLGYLFPDGQSLATDISRCQLSIIIWPSYAIICGFVSGFFLRIRRVWLWILFAPLIVIACYLPAFIEGCFGVDEALMGLLGYRSTLDGWNTSKVSFFLIPILVIAGSFLSVFVQKRCQRLRRQACEFDGRRVP